MVKEFILEGLNCANCGAKIEQGVSRLPGVTNATVNFLNKTLILETEETANFPELIRNTEGIVKKYEPEVNVIEKKEVKIKDDGDQNEEENQKKRLISLGLGGGLFTLAFLPFWSPGIEFALFLLSYLIVGGEVLMRAGKNILRGQVFDENFLMSIATLGAFAIREYPEGVAVMLFYQIGEYFQDRAVGQSRRSIKALLDIRPEYVNLSFNGVIKRVSPEEAAIGDMMIIKPGERVPLDGKVLEGQAMMDTSALTGESVPRRAKIGDDVLSGFINKDGLLTVQVAKVYGVSTIAKILDLVQNAGSKKAPTEKFITKFAHYYTPAVVLVAVLLAILPPLLIESATFSDWFYRALVFLVVSCPCALVISIPLGFFGGIGAASKKGILVKGGNYLEAINQIDTVVFDKTGTLTKGVFQVTGIHPAGSFTEEEVLEFAALAEFNSNHPIAQSVVQAYDQRLGNQLHQENITGFQEIAGHGVKVQYEGQEILAGNDKLMKQGRIDFQEWQEGGTVVYLAVSGKFAGTIVISDELKEDAKKTMQDLKQLGINKLVMLTGDNQETGQRVGRELSLDRVYAELLPADKVGILERIIQEKTSKKSVVFVGDGINDAPVLARADVGVAMGGLGSDAAIEAADIVLMTDEPAKLAEAVGIARKTRNVVWQNIIFALGVKLVVLVLGAGGLATLWEAVFADVGVAIIAVINAMRLLKS
ncbi:heavy metal translocating P-type ATPase [Dehalobacterium formicoaceticum]|uniref:heavy metal translocating P-type ATPase n=1 Tax=Dehalobacterium formicoaceticum TaxID=51515 RepID=UPI000B7D8BBE|nr:heavy metal translocating P-type ATPase [Dehalobacterium formicoaceticum]